MYKLVLILVVILLVGCNEVALEVQVDTINPSVFDISDGEISLDITGGKTPYKIMVNDVSSEALIGNLDAGVYEISITDKKDQQYETTVTLTAPLSLSVKTYDVEEAFGNTGSIVLDIQGGTEPYSIKVNNEDMNSLDQLTADIYTIEVRDAKNNIIIEGAEIKEPMTSTITDLEGNVYNVVKINDQWWMANNLKVTLDLEGNDIEYMKYKDDNTLSKKYGYIYLYDTVKQPLIEGWRLPTHDEFKALERFLGMAETEIEKMNTYKRGFNESFRLLADGDTGFNVEFSGYYSPENGFNGMKTGIAYMTAPNPGTEESDSVIVRTIMKDDGRIYCYEDPKTWGFYVRLIKD